MKIFFWKSHPLRKHLIFLSFFRKKLKSEYSDHINAPLVLSSTISILLLWIKKGGKESPELLLTYINYARDTSPTELLQP